MLAIKEEDGKSKKENKKVEEKPKVETAEKNSKELYEV